MDASASIGWMKMGLRANVCCQCRPMAATADRALALMPHLCETNCALFTQLPRLARFLDRHRGKPPSGYEEFVYKLLNDFTPEVSSKNLSSNPEAIPGPFLDHSFEAIGILEKIALLFTAPPADDPTHGCARRSMALGQLSVLKSYKDPK
jgi:hypothetical protein